MKQFILKQLAKYHYPQIVFGRAIKSVLKRKQIKKIIDAPCGNGEVSYHLSKIKGLEVYGYDIFEDAIKTARKNFVNEKLHFENKNIFDIIDTKIDADVFCLINSLFLFKDYDTLLKKLYENLNTQSLLILIVPNIKGQNYMNFKKDENNRNLNHLELNENEVYHFFSQYNFRVLSIKGLAYAHHYGRKDTKYLSVFSHFYLIIIDGILRIIRPKSILPNYFLILLKKI